MGKIGMPMQRIKPMAHASKRVPEQRNNPNAPVFTDAIHKAYCAGILHGIERQRAHARMRLIVHCIVLAGVTFCAVYGASRVLDYVQTRNDGNIVECRQ
jgi:hypothetical protein